jgi:hypothetical protein
MTDPIIGWQQETPVPDHYVFNDYLSARQGRLHYDDLDLAQLLRSLLTPSDQNGWATS